MKKKSFMLFLGLLISIPALADTETMVTESDIYTAHNYYDKAPISVVISIARPMSSEKYAIKTTVRYTSDAGGNKRKRVNRSFLFYPVVGKIIKEGNQLVWNKGDGRLIPVAKKKGMTWKETDNVTLKYKIDYKSTKMIFSAWAEIQ